MAPPAEDLPAVHRLPPAPRRSAEDHGADREPYDNLSVMLLRDWYSRIPVREVPADATRAAARRQLDYCAENSDSRR